MLPWLQVAVAVANQQIQIARSYLDSRLAWRLTRGLQRVSCLLDAHAHPRFLCRKVSLTDAQFAILADVAAAVYVAGVLRLYFPTICFQYVYVCAICSAGAIRALVMAQSQSQTFPPPHKLQKKKRVLHGQHKQQQKSRYFTCELFVSGKVSAHVSP